jgi:hypothetical protein
MGKLGGTASELIMILIGVFLAIAAYSRQPLLLRLGDARNISD